MMKREGRTVMVFGVGTLQRSIIERARQMGLRTVGVSCISNLACGMTDKPLSHEEVQQAADAVSARFTALVTEAVGELGKLL